jgi:hypothetical protein
MADNPDVPLHRALPCRSNTSPPTAPAPLRQHGLAKLEFALSVAVAGVLITLALTALSNMQVLGDAAVRVTQASQQSAAAAARQAQCALTPGAPAPTESLTTPQPGTAASTPIRPRSCP